MKDIERGNVFDRIMSMPFLARLNPLYVKYKSILLYLFFGGLTTVISIVSFVLFDRVLHIHTLIANVFSWICAVSFAYVTNRIWVFRSTARGSAIVTEILGFFGGRLATLGIEELILLVFVTLLHFNSTWIKIAGQVVVLVLNFVISKVFVFRQKNSRL